MIITENYCVGSCEGWMKNCKTCSQRNVEVMKCDICGEYANVHLEDEDLDLCEACLEEELNAHFKGLSLEEKIELLADETDIRKYS